jgi:hypothetical protein
MKQHYIAQTCRYSVLSYTPIIWSNTYKTSLQREKCPAFVIPVNYKSVSDWKYAGVLCSIPGF